MLPQQHRFAGPVAEDALEKDLGLFRREPHCGADLKRRLHVGIRQDWFDQWVLEQDAWFGKERPPLAS